MRSGAFAGLRIGVSGAYVPTDAEFDSGIRLSSSGGHANGKHLDASSCETLLKT
jgi:hypothetical protein